MVNHIVDVIDIKGRIIGNFNSNYFKRCNLFAEFFTDLFGTLFRNGVLLTTVLKNLIAANNRLTYLISKIKLIKTNNNSLLHIIEVQELNDRLKSKYMLMNLNQYDIIYNIRMIQKIINKHGTNLKCYINNLIPCNCFENKCNICMFISTKNKNKIMKDVLYPITKQIELFDELEFRSLEINTN